MLPVSYRPIETHVACVCGCVNCSAPIGLLKSFLSKWSVGLGVVKWCVGVGWAVGHKPQCVKRCVNIGVSIGVKLVCDETVCDNWCEHWCETGVKVV